MPQPDRRINSGFTLIEMSISLVVIGLIIGGILTGLDLKDAAAQRAQIAQIEKYNTAVHTFQLKFGGYLPGDIPDPYASQFGFQARGTAGGEGDGNGIIQGTLSGVVYGQYQSQGETTTFWVDLSTAGLMDGGFNAASPTTWNNITPAKIPQFLPSAKIGGGNWVLVWSMDGTNYFGIQLFPNGVDVYASAQNGITVQQAYNIDQKIDDGSPVSGNVIACLPDHAGYVWPGSGNYCDDTAYIKGSLGRSAIACFDNNSHAYPTRYSTDTNANAMNCALSFKFQ